MAPLAITTESPFRLLIARATKGFDTQGYDGGAQTPAATYALNLAKLIPGDVIAFYTLVGQLKAPTEWAAYHVTPFLACLVLVTLRAFATTTPSRGPRWLLVALSLATFICWIYAQNDWFWTWQVNAFGRYIFNALLLTLAFIAPIFVGKDT